MVSEAVRLSGVTCSQHARPGALWGLFLVQTLPGGHLSQALPDRLLLSSQSLAPGVI